MTKIEIIKEEILKMFGGSSVVESTRIRLISFLNDVRAMAFNEHAGDVAETLLGRLGRFSTAFCSEKQAYVIAYAADHYGIAL